MTVNKSKVYIYTVISVLLYVLIEFAVVEKPFTRPLFGESLFGGDASWLTWLCLIAIIVLGVMQAMQLGDREVDVTQHVDSGAPGQVNDPGWWQALSGNSLLSVLWLPLRFVLGINWIDAGWEKIIGTGWVSSGEVVRNGQTVTVNVGDSMKGFLANALAIDAQGNPLQGPDGTPVAAKVAFGWYGDFIHWIWSGQTGWFGPLVAYGEFLVGLGLLVGGLVGIAAFFGSLMNMAFMLAGSAGVNPWMFGMTVFIILGWKVAGYLGFDRWFLRFLRTPWDRMRPETASTVPSPTIGGGR